MIIIEKVSNEKRKKMLGVLKLEKINSKKGRKKKKERVQVCQLDNWELENIDFDENVTSTAMQRLHRDYQVTGVAINGLTSSVTLIWLRECTGWTKFAKFWHGSISCDYNNIQSTLVISTSVISNNLLSRRENLIPVLT